MHTDQFDSAPAEVLLDGRTLLAEVGGSGVRVATVGGTGPEQVAVTPFGPLGQRRGLTGLLMATGAAIRQVDGGVERVVVAWPGPLSPDGIALATPTVAGGVEHLDVVAGLTSELGGAEVVVLNDLTAAGMVERARGRTDFAIVTIGSGIGHKVFAGGEPLVGVGGRGGEIGHLVVDPDPAAARCSCGQRGHLGAVASGRAIVTAGMAVLDPSRPVDGTDPQDGRRVVRALEAADPGVVEVVSARGRMLGWALAALHVGVGVEEFVLMGGFALAAGEAYRQAVVEGARAACWDLGLDWDAAITLATNGPHPGLAGAWLVACAHAWS